MLKKTPNRVIVTNIVCMGVLSGISVIMMPIYSHLLGTENYGLASVYTTWVTILSVVVGLQFPSSLAIAKRDFKTEEQLSYQGNGAYIGALMSAALFLLVAVFSNQLTALVELPKWSLLLLAPHAFGIFCVNLLNGKFTYEFKQEKNLFISVGMSVGAALLSVIMILWMPENLRYFAKVIGTAIPQILCGCILVGVMLYRVGPHMKWKYTKYAIMYGWPLVFSNLCLQLFSGSDKLMLQKMQSNSVVGVYSFAFNFSAVISSIWYALNHAWSPFYYQYEEEGNDKNLLDHMNNYTRLFSILAIGFLLLSPEVFRWFSAKDFWPGKSLVPLFAIGFYANFIGCFARNHQYYYKKTKTIAGVSIAAAVLNLGLNCLLIPLYGAFGAALATMMVQVCSAFIHWQTAKHFASHVRKFPYSVKPFLPYFTLLLGAAMMFYTEQLWWIRWSLGAVLGLYLMRHLWKTKQIF